MIRQILDTEMTKAAIRILYVLYVMYICFMRNLHYHYQVIIFSIIREYINTYFLILMFTTTT